MRREELYLADLIDNARAVRGYLDGVTRERWDAEGILRDAVLYRMLLLGEIASALPDELRDRHPDVAWRQIRAFRNLAVHSTSGSTGRLSGRSPRKSRLSWRARCWRLSARSIPHWREATRPDLSRIRVRHPYAITVTRSISACTHQLGSSASSSLACFGLWQNLRRKSEVTAASCCCGPGSNRTEPEPKRKPSCSSRSPSCGRYQAPPRCRERSPRPRPHPFSEIWCAVASACPLPAVRTSSQTGAGCGERCPRG